jgi:ATP-binding cassette subfamily B protein
MFDDDNDGFDDKNLARTMRFGLWRKVFSFATRYPRQLRYMTGSAIGMALAELGYPWVTKSVIDAVQAQGVNARLAPYAWAYLACTVALAGSVGGFIWSGSWLRHQVNHDIRASAFANVQRMAFSFFDHRPAGWLMARMTSDCERLSQVITWSIVDVARALLLMFGVAVAMLLLDSKLALCSLVFVPLLIWVSGRFQKRLIGSARDVRRINSRITASYNEGIMGVLTSKAFVREHDNLRDFQGLTTNMHDASVRNQTQAALYLPIVVTIVSLALGLALALGGRDLLHGVISAGTLIAFMAYLRTFFDPMEQIGRTFVQMQMSQAAAERVLWLLDAQPAITDSEAVQRAIAAETSSPPRPGVASDGGTARIERIEFAAVSFSYDGRREVLRDVDLMASRGETIAIVGPTGGGKSTLVNILCRFYEPTRGRVLVDGCDYRERGLGWLQSNLGMVLQNAHVFSGTILENIRYGRLGASDEEVIAAAQLAGAHELVLALADGYATQVGEGGARLSAGQKQLVSFARAILADPQILIMDEATSSVDTETERRIQRGLVNVLAGRISFVIAHRLSTIRQATRIIVVEDGRISEAGTHAELTAKRGHYFQLYRQQSLQETTRALAQ